MSKGMIQELISRHKPEVEKALAAALVCGNARGARIYEAANYAVGAGGKRLRPILVIATADAIKPRGVAVLGAACAVELVHTASLILDDLPSMDDAGIRRGKPTCHAAFGEATAILAADALLMRAFEVLAANCRQTRITAEETSQAVEALARAVGADGMIGGQQADLDTAAGQADFDALEYISSRKTGALFVACVELGGIMRGARHFELMALRNYARNLGLAFQVRDDILDAVGDPAKLGKDVHQDAKRATFVTQFGVESARKVVADLCRVAEESLAALPKRSEPLIALSRYVAETEE